MSTFHNRTRRSRSIPRKLLSERRPHLIPVYYLLLTSELANEGIHHSGSYRFADHIYANTPNGRFLVGRALDRLLLGFPSARALRSRYLFAKEEIRRALQATGGGDDVNICHGPTGRGCPAVDICHGQAVDILSIPSGYAREQFEVADELRASGDPAYERVRWHCLDLDQQLVETLSARARDAGHPMSFSVADALSDDVERDWCDLAISIGFTEFLDDEQTARFYGLVHARLRPGGRFVTSGMQRHRLSDYLLRNIGELHTNYRTEAELRALCEQAGFTDVRSRRDATGLQTMIVAVKE